MYDPYMEGRQAGRQAIAGKQYTPNPYVSGGTDYWAWESGWNWSISSNGW